MRLSEKAKQPVRPRDFWLAVGVTIVLLTVIGVYAVRLEHSSAGSWFWAAGLIVMWSIHLWSLFRFGLRAYSWDNAAVLLGVTLIFGTRFWPQTSTAVTWAEGCGAILMIVGVLAPYFSSNPRPKRGSSVR